MLLRNARAIHGLILLAGLCAFPRAHAADMSLNENAVSAPPMELGGGSRIS